MILANAFCLFFFLGEYLRAAGAAGPREPGGLAGGAVRRLRAAGDAGDERGAGRLAGRPAGERAAERASQALPAQPGPGASRGCLVKSGD